MIKVNCVEFFNNDVYYMNVLENILVINRNYEGIIVLDKELKLIDEIELIEDLTIYESFTSGKNLLLFCPDNNCLIYININSHQKKIISLNGFEDWIFSKLYEWTSEHLILSDYKGRYAKVDLENEHITEVLFNEIDCRNIQELSNKLQKHTILKLNTLENTGFIKMSNSKVGLIEIGEDIVIVEEFEQKKYHDFETTKGYILKVGEEKIEVIFKNEIEIQYPVEHYEFLRGKIMCRNDDVFVFILCADKFKTNHAKIEMYKF